MKNSINFHRKLLYYTLLLSILVSLSISCKKDDEPAVDYVYLVDYDKKSSLSIPAVQATFMVASVEYPEMSYLTNHTRYGVDVYSIRYKTNYRGEEITASGLVCVPDEAESFPVISFQNGTNTLHAHAPSIDNSNSLFMLIEALAGNGYIVLIPDYIGFGSSEHIIHPYYEKESTTGAVIDMLFAAREMLDYYDGDATYNFNQYLMGYSQGGWSTLATLSVLETMPGLPFEVKATSCGSGAYDLIDVSRYILGLDSFPGPLYLPYYIYSHKEYGSLHDTLNVFFNEPYASIIPQLFNGIYSNSEVNAQLSNSIPELLNADFINNFETSDSYHELLTDLELNSVYAWETSSPIHFFHGNADLNVPVFESQNMHQSFADLGMSGMVEYTELDTLNHETGIVPWGLLTMQWFNSIEYPEL